MAQAINLDQTRAERAGKYRKPNVPKPPPKYSQRSGIRGFVRFMKIVLPLLALTFIGAAIIWPQMNPVDDWDFQIPILSQQDDAENTTMLRVSFEGRDSKDRPFRITADSAESRDESDDIIDLLNLDADITMTSGTWIAVSATQGVYDKVAGTLDLTGGVNLFQDQGYELSTDKAQVTLENGDLVSTTPVRGQGPFGLITAEGLEVREDGKVIYFTGQTELLLEADGLNGLQ